MVLYGFRHLKKSKIWFYMVFLAKKAIYMVNMVYMVKYGHVATLEEGNSLSWNI